jgi:uncharacterized protein
MPMGAWYVKLTGRKQLAGLLEHYGPAEKVLSVIDEALRGYLSSGASRSFQALMAEVSYLESQADKIKRRVRNHMPRAMFMEVDKTLFLNYTRYQDNILDEAQIALNWLGMRQVDVPLHFHEALFTFRSTVSTTVNLLKPALSATISLIYGQTQDRAAVKECFFRVRSQQLEAAKAKNHLMGELMSSTDLDFKDAYQLMKFVEGLHGMSHNAEGCADVLRAMIAR